MEIVHKTQMISMSDGMNLALHSWIPKKVEFIVHISHGMAEYALRYDRLARFLCEHNIAVFAHDIRGHGQSISEQTPKGHLADKDGFNRVTMDLFEIIQYTKTTYASYKYILLGHSFGSFIAQNFLTQYSSSINSLILSGTTANMAPLGFITKLTASILAIFKSIRHPSPFMTNLAFGSYNAKIKNAQSSNAWLSRDEKEVALYDESDLCGFPCTLGFYRDLGNAFCIINKSKSMRKIPKNVPILLIAGTDDPVGNYGKKVTWLYNTYENLQFTSKIILYPQGRHESLNETNKDQVQNDILSWITHYS